MGDQTYLAAQTAEWERYTTHFPDRESANGPGSTLQFTQALRGWLPQLLAKYQIKSILDAPCGDWTWMQRVNLRGIAYTGFDIDPDNIALAKQRANNLYTFRKVNLLTRKTFPKVDLIICRDFMAHIPDEYIQALLVKFRYSGSKYLLATTFDIPDNTEIGTDQDGFAYRPVNLQAEPYNLYLIDSITEPGPEFGRHMALYVL